MCGRIWLPRPSTKRPPDSSCMSWPRWASVMGVRAKAMATDVPSSMVSVSPAAATSGRNPSWRASGVKMPA